MTRRTRVNAVANPWRSPSEGRSSISKNGGVRYGVAKQPISPLRENVALSISPSPAHSRSSSSRCRTRPRVVVFGRITKGNDGASATVKALLIKRDTGPLTYDLHARLAANRIEVWRLRANFALVQAAGVEARVLQQHLLMVRASFLK